MRDLLGRAAGLPFDLLARVRGGKSLHTRGQTYRATIAIDGAPGAPPARLLSEPGEHAGFVRFSRGAGLPPGLPDVFGAAIRVEDAYGPRRHQDLLLVTSVDRPILHHLLVPVRDAQQRPLSSLAPYRAGGASWLLGLVPRADSPRGAGDTLDDRLADAAATGRLAYDLGAAGVGGRFARIGVLRVGARLPESFEGVRFNVFNTGDDLRPATIVNRVRRGAYAQAQAGWAA